jgi:hypothetical protein
MKPGPAKKRTCYGCRALNFKEALCILGYPIELKDKTPLLPEPIPMEICPKPRTYAELSKVSKR